jgi:NADH dehydrogenase/NADH:ubiquinone oxidoreductase subunit G
MNIIIDGIACEALHGEYILQVARRNGIKIPALCHHDALSGIGSCRLCVVEVIEEGKSKIVASCLYPITRELEVRTHSEKLTGIRRTIMKLLLERTSFNEQLRNFAEKYDIYSTGEDRLIQGKDECMLCGLCVKACEKLGNSAISTVGRGVGKKVAPPYEEPPGDCIGCGSCASVCPREQ